MQRAFPQQAGRATGPVPARPVAQTAVRPGGPLRPADLLHLQRTVGNRAVQRMLVSRLAPAGSAGPVVQRKWVLPGTGYELSDEQWARLLEQVDDYDASADFAKTATLSDDDVRTLTQINIALGNINSILAEAVGSKPSAIAWLKTKALTAAKGEVKGTHPWKGNLAEALATCEGGGQCNNEMAKRIRACLQSFQHEDDDVDEEDGVEDNARPGPSTEEHKGAPKTL